MKCIMFVIFLTSLTLVSQLCLAEYIVKCHSGGESATTNYSLYTRISANSKYMHLSIKYWDEALWSKFAAYSYEDAAADCKSHFMDIAKITSLADFKSIDTYLKSTFKSSLNPTYDTAGKTQHWIAGTNRLQGVQEWTFENSNTLTFQAFYGWNPQNTSYTTKSSANYLALLPAFSKDPIQTGGKYDYTMTEMENNPWPIYHFKLWFCQFKTATPCHRNSIEEKETIAYITDTCASIGETKCFKDKQNKYYISRIQKTYRESEDYCKSKNMNLLRLEADKDGPGLYKILRGFLLKNGLASTSHSFFIDGRNTQLFGCNAKVKWEWLDNHLLDQTADPFVEKKVSPGTRDFGRCLSTGTIFSKRTVFTLARSLCTLPRWCVCYKTKPCVTSTTKRPTIETTTPKTKPSTPTTKTTTTTKPTTPTTKPTTPKTKPSTPTTKTTTTTKPTTPTTKPTTPTTKPTTPKTKPTTPKTKPTTPKTKPTTPKTKPTTPKTKPTTTTTKKPTVPTTKQPTTPVTKQPSISNTSTILPTKKPIRVSTTEPTIVTESTLTSVTESSTVPITESSTTKRTRPPFSTTKGPHSPTTKGWGPHSPTTKGWGPHSPTTKGWGPHSPTTKGWGPHIPTTKGWGPLRTTTKGSMRKPSNIDENEMWIWKVIA